MNKKSFYKNLIVSVAFLALSLGFSTPVYATCESTYGGGEKCVYNKSFDIEKKVRKEGDSKWKDKVTDVEEDEVVEFRIRIKNVGEVETDNMKMIDDLPDAMERVGGSGLTEYFDNFAPGEVEEFIIKAKVKDKEYDRDNFDKCVVNEIISVIFLAGLGLTSLGVLIKKSRR